MKSINFINSRTPKQQREVRRWFITSCTLMGLTLCIMTTIQLRQWLSLRAIKQEAVTLAATVTNFDEVMTLHAALKQEHQQLENQARKVSQRALCKINPVDCLGTINSVCALKKTNLVSCTMHKQQVELLVQVSNAQAATDYLAALNSSGYFSQLSLTHIQPTKAEKNAGLSCTYKGILTPKES